MDSSFQTYLSNSDKCYSVFTSLSLERLGYRYNLPSKSSYKSYRESINQITLDNEYIEKMYSFREVDIFYEYGIDTLERILIFYKKSKPFIINLTRYRRARKNCIECNLNPNDNRIISIFEYDSEDYHSIPQNPLLVHYYDFKKFIF